MINRPLPRTAGDALDEENRAFDLDSQDLRSMFVCRDSFEPVLGLDWWRLTFIFEQAKD